LIRPAAAILLFGAACGSAAAQDRTDISQVSTGPVLVAASDQAPPPTSEAPSQLSTGSDSRPAETQLTSAGISRQQPSQVATRSKDPQASEPISTPAQGRTAAVERVNGRDRCDPSEGKDKTSAECKKVIENRAAEYRRAPPTELSPEQKLLIDQQLRANANAAQQLAHSGDPENNAEAMGIASLVLSQNKEPDAPDKKQTDAQSDAAVQAIISAVQGGSPQD
jgi:hypothetical protein